MPKTRMRPFGDVISLDAARAILDRTGSPLERVESVPLERAAGRVLARDVIAAGDVPPFSRAGMDGYALRSADAAGATRRSPRALTHIGTLYSGQMPSRAVREGECLEIATGAPVPEGADAVIMVEDTDLDDAGRVLVFADLKPGQNIGRRGADIQAGQVVVAAGETLNASRIGALAAIGASAVEVYDRPRVAILSTGNEVVEPGRPLQPGQIYDINRYTLSAVVSEHGGLPVPFPPAPDSLEALIATLESCLANDVVVFSGGSSVGERDLMLDAITARGRLLFHGVAVKPGKPTGLGLVDGTPIFAMPGYPTSCLSNAHMLLVPLLRRMARLGPQIRKTLTLPLSQRIASAKGRHQFYTVRVENGMAVPAFKASGDITSMSRADGYIEIAADVDVVEAGTSVDVTLF